jgi:hypothetical protein
MPRALTILQRVAAIIKLESGRRRARDGCRSYLLCLLSLYALSKVRLVVGIPILTAAKLQAKKDFDILSMVGDFWSAYQVIWFSSIQSFLFQNYSSLFNNVNKEMFFRSGVL